MKQKVDYSLELMKYKDDKEVSELLFRLDIPNIRSLESRVIKQFRQIDDTEEKRCYANNIIIANNLPICIEITRIISNGYSINQYVRLHENTRKAKDVYCIYEEFLNYSDVLQERQFESKKRLSMINSKDLSYKKH